MIKDLINLLSFSQKFAEITRSVKIGARESLESDAEHSHQLGLIAWYIAERLRLEVDTGLLLKYAAIHDLVEVYAGDTDPHVHSADFKASKAEREKIALERIRIEFPDFPSLHDAIRTYEMHSGIESRLVYAVDKILPVLNTFLSRHTYYITNAVSFETWKNWFEEKMSRVDGQELLGSHFIGELTDFLRQQEGLFSKPK